MKTFSFLRVVAVALYMFALPCTSVYGQQQPVVSYKVIFPLSVKAGDSLQLVVSVDVAPDWYLYAATKANRKQNLQVTEVNILKMAQVFSKVGPDMLPALQFRQGHEAYAGEKNDFRFLLQTDSAAAPGKYELEVQLLYQACNQVQCLAPVSEQNKIIITITE